jgi:hypothetical protein
MTEEKFETLKILSGLPLIQAEMEKELRLRTLMPSVPVTCPDAFSGRACL